MAKLCRRHYDTTSFFVTLWPEKKDLQKLGAVVEENCKKFKQFYFLIIYKNNTWDTVGQSGCSRWFSLLFHSFLPSHASLGGRGIWSHSMTLTWGIPTPFSWPWGWEFDYPKNQTFKCLGRVAEGGCWSFELAGTLSMFCLEIRRIRQTCLNEHALSDLMHHQVLEKVSKAD